MRVVSDTSPLYNLAVIGRLDLLQVQFDQVIAPEGVIAELRPVRREPAGEAIQQAIEVGWLTVQVVRQMSTVRAIAPHLGRGEAGKAGTLLDHGRVGFS